MNDEPLDNNLQPEPVDARSARRLDRRRRRSGSWIGGAVLIALGVVFLLQNMGVVGFDNWWALFILIPAFGAFSSAWDAYQDAGGRLDRRARGSLFGGLILTLVCIIFLFGLSWTYLGPAILILVGVGILLNAFVSKDEAG
jgi:hypothetical protein